MAFSARGNEVFEDYPHANSNINSNTTTILKTIPGTLHTITINSPGASSNIATVYDSPTGSGTVLAVIDTTKAGLGTLLYDIQFTSGLTIVTSAGTCADITVSFA